MGTIADSLFAVLMSWVRALVNSLWALFSSENSLLAFLGKNWLLLAGGLIAAGLVIDWTVWLIRWQPYHMWARFWRRLLRLPEKAEIDEDIDEEELRRRREELYAPPKPAQEPEEDDVRVYAPASAGKESPYARPSADEYTEEDEPAQDDSWLPLPPVFDEEDEEEAVRAAQEVPDEELHAYPGMRYGAHAQSDEELGGTQRYAAVHSEGPGAAEVSRRRAEIDAWQQQMKDEARAEREAQLEKARREREAEKARLAEEERLAEEAEAARLAQEEYERQLAEYEIKKAEYERQQAEYERKQAEYERQQAEYERAQRAWEAQQTDAETSAELTAAQPRARRRRAAAVSYSEMIPGEHVDELPPPPAWPQMARAPQPEPRPEPKAKKENGLLDRMARMIEPEEEELASLHALPPRVDKKDAYKPAKKPEKPGRRNRG